MTAEAFRSQWMLHDCQHASHSSIQPYSSVRSVDRATDLWEAFRGAASTRQDSRTPPQSHQPVSHSQGALLRPVRHCCKAEPAARVTTSQQRQRATRSCERYIAHFTVYAWTRLVHALIQSSSADSPMHTALESLLSHPLPACL